MGMQKDYNSRECFSSKLAPDALRRILDRVEENLVFRRVIADQRRIVRELDDSLSPLTSTILSETDRMLSFLRDYRAPVFTPRRRGWRKFVAFIINWVLRLFGRKQIVYNEQVIDILGKNHQLYSIMISHLDDQARRVAEVQRGLEEQQRGLEEQERGLRERQGGLEQRQGSLEEQQRGFEEWIRLVHTEARDIALAVRTELGVQAVQLKSDETVARAGGVDLSELPKDLRINVGCGHRPMDGYVNIDCRDIPEASFVADARALPFELGSVAELVSSHLVEHFREHEFRHKILPHWRALLKSSGILRIICPNWDAMVRQLTEGRMNWARFKEITFGGQEYDGNDHFAMYTPETLLAALRENGFSRVEIIETERDNGGCPEMELIAVKDEM